MPLGRNGDWIPSKRSQHRCDGCRRHFAEDAVPWPNGNGQRICRDCREEKAYTGPEAPNLFD